MNTGARTKRIALILLALAVLGAGLGFGALRWRAQARQRREARAIETVQALIAAGRWAEAAQTSDRLHRALGPSPDPAQAAAWRVMDFRIAGAQRDLPRLVALAELDPALVAADESAALWLYRTYDAAAMGPQADGVRQAWQGREAAPADWTCADADRLIATKRIDEARVLLARRSYPGKDDVGRLLRLILVTAERPTEVARLLDEAYRRDPKNADVRTMRGQLLEQVGQIEYARIEFMAALAADPANPLQRDQLGRFYLRQRNLPQAAQVLAEKLGAEAPDFMWERASFLARLTGRPGPPPAALPADRRAAYGGWLASLPPGEFWDGPGYEGLHLSPDHALQRASAFWLALIERIRRGDEDGAAQDAARAARPATRESPALHAALRLAFAVRGGAGVTATGIRLPPTQEGEHVFLRNLRAAAGGDTRPGAAEAVGVLRSRNGLAACFLAEGWIAPALALADLDAALSAPSWLQYGLIQVLRELRGGEAALAFAVRLPAQPATDYLRAELLLKVGREPEALAILDRLAQGRGDVAYSAGWLRAIRLVELKRHPEALATIESCADLRTAVAGAELRARIALLRGDSAAADQQYRALREQSLEAGAYMARKAFAARDWREARRLTTHWLQKQPDNLQLRRNLAAIAEEENRR